jgi:hypothetical protein
MGREVLIGRIEIGLVAMGLAEGALEVVRDDDLGNTIKEGQRAHRRADPVRESLGPGRLGVRVVRGPEHRHEDLGITDLPGGTIHYLGALCGIVDEQLLAAPVALAHDHVQVALPTGVVIAEAAVGVAVGVALAVLLPQQKQGHALAPQLTMNRGKIRLNALGFALTPGLLEQPSLQRRGVHPLGQRPSNPRRLGTSQVLRDRRSADTHGLGDLPR